MVLIGEVYRYAYLEASRIDRVVGEGELIVGASK